MDSNEVTHMRGKAIILFLILLGLAFPSLVVVEYYGEGCPHCARVDGILQNLTPVFGLNLTRKEVYYDAQNRQEMFADYARFGLNPAGGGVPTLVIGNRSILVGEMTQERYSGIFRDLESNASLSGVYTSGSFSGIKELDPSATLTPLVLVGAAVADSVNPCTIAIMALLLGTIMRTRGKRKVLEAAGAFVGVVFVVYLLMGLGILRALAEPSITNAFFTVVTFAALVLAILELKAYLSYSPGFLSIEIPMFLRPYMKGVLSKATSVPGVAFAALVCSLFLLPCSSGPYLIVLGMLARSFTLEGFVYLVIYNLIFILPMVLVALVIYAGKATADEVGEFREAHIRKFHLISGLIFLALFLLLLAQLLGVF
jgi:hypothetical protein